MGRRKTGFYIDNIELSDGDLVGAFPEDGDGIWWYNIVYKKNTFYLCHAFGREYLWGEDWGVLCDLFLDDRKSILKTFRFVGKQFDFPIFMENEKQTEFSLCKRKLFDF